MSKLPAPEGYYFAVDYRPAEVTGGGKSNFVFIDLRKKRGRVDRLLDRAFNVYGGGLVSRSKVFVDGLDAAAIVEAVETEAARMADEVSRKLSIKGLLEEHFG